MKLKAIERILLILVSILLLCISAIAIMIAWDFVSQSYVELIVRSLYSVDINTWIITAGAALVVIIAVGVFCVACSTGKKKTMPYISISTADGGNIKISVKSLVEMVSRQVKQVPGINANVSSITNKDGKIGVIVKISVSEETAIPEVSNKIQVDVKEAVQALSGIAISNVDVYVDNSLSGQKA